MKCLCAVLGRDNGGQQVGTGWGMWKTMALLSVRRDGQREMMRRRVSKHKLESVDMVWMSKGTPST